MGNWTQADVDAVLRMRRSVAVIDTVPSVGLPKRSKYRNVKTWVGDACFDSKGEAEYWLLLKARESRGEISELDRQVRFPLVAPDRSRPGVVVQISEYVADFLYNEQGVRHVVDWKGHRTREYVLKAKWLFLQDGISIEEISA